jgi:hypothetical protein
METQMTVSISLGCFDDQSHIATSESRHIKLELCITERPGFGGKFRRLCGAFHFRCDLGAFDAFLSLIPHDDLKESAFARKPSFGIEQLGMEMPLPCIRWRCCFWRRIIAIRRKGNLERSGAKFFHDGTMLLIHTEFQSVLAFWI